MLLEPWVDRGQLRETRYYLGRGVKNEERIRTTFEDQHHRGRLG